MTAQNVAFWVLAIAMGGGAVGVVRSRNIVHAALFLIIVLVGAAAQYIVLLAEFVGITQFFIYIGAIAVLFLFGIMLTQAHIGRVGQLESSPAGARSGTGTGSSTARAGRRSCTPTGRRSGTATVGGTATGRPRACT